jgi:hypothetical protein
MITEGQHLYVFCRKRVKQKDSGDYKIQICVLIYRISKDFVGFEYLRYVTLMKNQQKAYCKENNKVEFVSSLA